MTDAQPEKKLFARFDTSRGDIIVEVSGIQEAIDIGLDQSTGSFQTYKAVSARKAVSTFDLLSIMAKWSRVAMEWEPGKKEAWERDKRENLSGKHYLGVDKIETDEGIVDKIQTAERIFEMYDTAMKSVEKDIRSYQATIDNLPDSFYKTGRLSFTDERAFKDSTVRALKRATDWRDECEQVCNTFSQYPPNTPCILVHVRGRSGTEIFKLEANDKVYNQQGQPIWPQPTAPAVRARPLGPGR